MGGILFLSKWCAKLFLCKNVVDWTSERISGKIENADFHTPLDVPQEWLSILAT